MSRKTTLTKGIEHAFGVVKAISDTGTVETSEPLDKERAENNIAQMAQDLRMGRLTKADFVRVFKQQGVEDPEGSAEAVIRQILRGDANSNNFTSLFTPGQRPGILSTGGRSRTTGYGTGRNYPGKIDDERATVSGGSVNEGKETGDYGPAEVFNPKTPGQGYPDEIGHERYSSDSSVAGSSSDKQPTAAQYRKPSVSIRGEVQPDFVVSDSPGRSGNYGRDSTLITRRDGRPTQKAYSLQRVYQTRLNKSMRDEDEERENFGSRVAGQPRQEELDRLMEEDVSGPVFTEEEIKTAIAQAEREELRAKHEGDPYLAAAKAQLKQDLSKMLFKQKIAKSYGQ